ncbi:DedA family protein [Clostridium sp. Marseille-P299]|uniref:DedA family protein n=1 Tax=Clostridium sp. Marseille-P299 TaxID=1805477 RepID=UPI000833A1CB|nr:DedA family protein [Clostridium sp. Marseille-P299]
MQDIIIEIMNQFGYFGILFLIAVENVFPPIPSEVILTFGGFMTTYSTMQPVIVVIVSTIGSLLGAIILYGVGRILSPERMKKILDGKIGQVLHFKSEDVEKSVNWFQKKGKITVLFCRCIPIVRSLISIPAGMAKMNLGLFFLFTTIGSLVWNTILVYLGVVAGASWERIAGYVDTYASVTLVVLVVVFLIAAAIFYKTRFKKNKDK